MSTAVAKSPVKSIRVTKKGEQSAANWIKGVLDGSGSSPAQIIVAVVIGCIPFVGQGVDVGNVIVSIVKIAENPNNKDNWFDLVFNLIAFVPVAGDGLKIVFKQLRSGKSMGAILDAIPSKTLRGDVEKWFRNLNWNAYTKELQKTVNKMIDRLINVFDSWMTRAVLGQARLKTLVVQLRKMKTVANRQIEMVMKDLQLAHKKALATPYPNTTAKAPIHKTGSKPLNRTSAPHTQQKGQVLKNTSGNTAKTGSKNTSTKRTSKKRSNKELGSGGEHITDYYFVKRKKNRSKINNNGVLYEYHDKGHDGIDHVWHSNSIGHRYRITDSKATNLASHRKIMTPKAAMDALSMGLDVYVKSSKEKKTKGALGKTVADGVQMSHLWIAKKIDSAKLTVEHRRKLIAQIQAWERVKFKASTEKRVGKTVAVQCPYDRSLVTITGNLFDHHSQCKGLDEPKCTRTVTAHAITLEFVLPNEMLER
ncbi:hypothetical protein N0P26_002943 [Acinetobacter baumannii]|uniref:Uncharacterized protein n=1 Tax=Acinetobacter baumannii TaxID=470 RepID=A0A9P2L8X8_ACIBA|nr:MULTISPECIES: hypothetical protein [Acinetobacter calcoaceticus/baumannii complex]EJB8466953.1 hypothetical protein [Acinetobacter baumannii]EKP44240.1 hypothetical protein ACIN5111_2958 [Acinetobacter baumannii OIFC111]EKT9122955.1 hypothetical protein [Acinetobacter baumannii]EKT9270575.1 hypothetical protein [Acinetobacter baumannii]EKT9313402.1 hypothetical protein [Acinetobacter baumannii]